VTWFFEDEITTRTRAILDGLPEGGAVVPCLWHLEVANALIVAARRKRFDHQHIPQAVGRLALLPVEAQAAPNAAQLRDILALATTQSLTMYDAAYLELARRAQAALATDDDALQRAARSIGIDLC